MKDQMPLSRLERMLLLLPLAGGAVFGLGPLLIAGVLGPALGYAANDFYIAHLAGASTFGYAVVLALAIWGDDWRAVRLPIVAVLVFNLASLFACVTEIAGGRAQPVVFLILGASVVLVGLTGWMLASHPGAPSGAQDVPAWLIGLIAVATVAALIFGLLPLLVPEQVGHFLGYEATDLFLYRQAGAATLGYGVMGILGLRSRRWQELRLPAVMGLVFNGLSFIVSVISLLQGEPALLPALVLPVSGLVTIGLSAALRRFGTGRAPAPAGQGMPANAK